MRRKLGRIVLAVLGVLIGLPLLGFGVVALYSSWKFGATYEAPAPELRRPTDPAALARGGRLFRTVCLGCHARPVGGARPLGRWMDDVPEFLGKFYTANLTSHRSGGIGAWSDAELARLIRYGVKRDGHVAAVMPRFGLMADEDIAAIVAFMRSGDPMFEPNATRQPPSEPSTVGKIVLVMVTGVEPRVSGPTHIRRPAEAPDVAFGRYMANAVYQCHDCHTEGFSGNKLEEPGLYQGGFDFVGVMSSNLTPDRATGIGAWTLEELSAAVRHGTSRGGVAVRYPMPRFREMPDVEVEAIYRYLRTVPAVRHPIPAGTPPRRRVGASTPPERMFADLGCSRCHDAGAPFHAHLQRARGRAPADVAAFVRNPERTYPRTEMPTYEQILPPEQALRLAQWVVDVAATR